jgi:N-methylhydantoinase A
MWRVGIDVGGTFTDLFAWEEKTGNQVTAKVLTTKQDRSIAVLESIEKAGIDISDISYLMHGTTTATNALIERSYPDAAFITTDGFRDTIEIGRQHRQYLYDPYQTKPKPVIKRRYRYTISERVNVRGESERPMDVGAAREVASRIKEAGIQSVGIGFINSYVGAQHEEQMRDILLEYCPDIHVEIYGRSGEPPWSARLWWKTLDPEEQRRCHVGWCGTPAPGRHAGIRSGWRCGLCRVSYQAERL